MFNASAGECRLSMYVNVDIPCIPFNDVEARWTGAIEAVAIPQRETFERGVEFTRAEGILPAPEANHAIAAAVREALIAKAEGKERVIVFNNCGHGFLDLAAYENYLAGKLEDLSLEQSKIEAALNDLPKP
jgi:tryptophan synthase beta chain